MCLILMKIEDILKLVPVSNEEKRKDWFLEKYGLQVGAWAAMGKFYSLACLYCEAKGKHVRFSGGKESITKAIKHALRHKSLNNKRNSK